MGSGTYSAKPSSEKFAQARGSNWRVHFKNTREVAHAIKGMDLQYAKKYLRDVSEHKRIIPYTRFKGSIGRHAQCKEFKVSTTGRWPAKSVKFVSWLLENVEKNAEAKDLDLENLRITHIQVNAAAKMRRRTYRAHGRINAYMSSPCHIEMIVQQAEENVERPDDDSAVVKSTRN
eukprot:Awhi_evm2s8804